MPAFCFCFLRCCASAVFMRRPSDRDRRCPAWARRRRSALRADSPAMLGPRSRGVTRYVRFAHCAQTDTASQFTKRAARADPDTALLVAPEIAHGGCRLPRGLGWGLAEGKNSGESSAIVWVRRRFGHLPTAQVRPVMGCMRLGAVGRLLLDKVAGIWKLPLSSRALEDRFAQ